MFLMGSSLSHRLRSARWAIGLAILASMRAQPADVTGTLPEDLFPALRPILVDALKKSPRTLAADIEIALQEARALQTASQRLPRLGGDINFSQNQTAVSGNTSTQNRDSGLFYRIEIGQALFHWGAIKNDVDRQKISVAIAQKNFAEAYRLVLLTLRQGYLELVGKKAFLVQQRHRQKIRETALALDEEKLSRGLVAPGYVEGQRLTVREQELDVKRSEVLFEAARRVFARAAGIADISEAEIPDSIPRPSYSGNTASAALAAMLRDGGRSSFEAQVYALQVREADLSYRIARVRLLPKFNASAGYYLENTTNATEFMVEQHGVERRSAAVGASWSIFDGFATRGAKREALASKRSAERRLATAGEDALERAQALERLLKIEATAMEFAEVRSAIATEALRRQTEEVTAGTLPPSAIEEAQSNVLLATANDALARANYLRTWSEFVSVVGIDPILNTLPPRYVREIR